MDQGSKRICVLLFGPKIDCPTNEALCQISSTLCVTRLSSLTIPVVSPIVIGFDYLHPINE